MFAAQQPHGVVHAEVKSAGSTASRATTILMVLEHVDSVGPVTNENNAGSLSSVVWQNYSHGGTDSAGGLVPSEKLMSPQGLSSSWREILCQICLPMAPPISKCQIAGHNNLAGPTNQALV